MTGLGIKPPIFQLEEDHSKPQERWKELAGSTAPSITTRHFSYSRKTREKVKRNVKIALVAQQKQCKLMICLLQKVLRLDLTICLGFTDYNQSKEMYIVLYLLKDVSRQLHFGSIKSICWNWLDLFWFAMFICISSLQTVSYKPLFSRRDLYQEL